MSDSDNKFEMMCGLTLAIFAALMAVSDLFAGKYGADEIKKTNNKAAAYMWYQSKSIRTSMVEGQRDLLKTLAESGALKMEHNNSLTQLTDKLTKKVERYEKEKQEILLGSKAVGEANWVQDVDGKLCQVIGAQEYEKQLEIIASAGDYFDFANLCFQMCLVLGAISLILKKEKIQHLFYWIMVVAGVGGTVFSVFAFNTVSAL